MPSTTSSSVSSALGLLDRDHALVADLLHRLGQIISPISVSPLAEMVPTWAISSLSDLLARTLLQLFDHGLDRQVDAALQVHRVHAGGNRLHALAHDGLGQHGGGGGAVAGGVVGLGGHLAHHLRAHVLELVLSSISLATVTPSLVMRGAPNDFSSTTLRPLGSRASP
jgi:hypothetical protein